MDSSLFKQLETQAREAQVEQLVAAAIIFREQKLLIVRRVPENYYGGFYEVPGGKVEPNEPLDRALKREVREEIGLEIENIQHYIQSFDYISAKGKKMRQFNFLVTLKCYEPILLQEHDHYTWCLEHEVQQYPLSPNMQKSSARVWEHRP